MRFRNDDFPAKKELTDTVSEEHPMHLAALAEERIKAMHHHSDGSSVEVHEVGSKEFIQQSISGSLEGKLGGNGFGSSNEEKQLQLQNTAKIEYEKKSSQGQPQQMYGAQHDLLGKGQSKTETVMMGCNCGAEWTVTGQSTKQDGSGVKIEQYGSASGGAAGYNVSAGAGGERIEYRAGARQQNEYEG